jgi:tRNA wybutosine-synthesizing protein 1
MFVGYSQQRLSIENMPRHEEIRAFSERIAKLSNYRIKDEKKESRVVLLERC